LHEVCKQRAFTFGMVGNFRMVRRLIAVNRSVYVLTDKSIERIDSDNLSQPAEIIARSAEFGSRCVFTDLIVSEDCMILGTNQGLFKKDPEGVAWQSIEIPGSVPSVTSLSVTSITGRAQDLVSEWGGMLYVLSGSRVSNRSHLSRYAVKKTQGGVELAVIKDEVKAGVVHPSVHFNSFRQYCVTDGSRYLHAVDRNGAQDPQLLFGGKRAIRKMPINFAQASQMTTALHSTALGSWIFAGDFGIKGNE
jgi:hypothetical protein